MLIELFIVLLKVVIDPPRLFLGNKALLNHVLGPRGVRYEHSH